MLKGYRGRFVALSMTLVAAVLLVVFVILGCFLYQNARTELRSTMRHVVQPWDFRMDGERSRTAPPEPRSEERDRGGQMPDDRERQQDQQITVVLWNETSGVAVLGDSDMDEETVAEAARQAASRKESYGTLEELGLIYYQEAVMGGRKIALADTSYLRQKALSNVLLLLLAYAVSLAALFPVSVWLSRLAAKPMEDGIKMEREFVANISHDLKTPITVILANNSILRANGDSTVAEQSQWIDSTEQAAKNMMDLVGEMLTLSSLESKTKTVEKVPVDLSSALEKSVLQMESVAYDRGVTVESEIPEGVTVCGDKTYLERICSGLLDNALKYEPDGGVVTVTLESGRKQIRLSVRNRGSRIPPEDLPHVFERFYRGDKARDLKTGHGLGLPIIRQMTELLGGQITASSSEADGTEFAVTFPAEGK